MIEDQTQLIEIFRNQYTCPLSGKVMKTPVMDSQGYSYQHQSIQQYFNNINKSIPISPLTGKQFSPKELIENIYLQNLIEKVQTQIPKIYSYIKLLKNQITHLKLQNQKLISQNQLNYEDSHTQSCSDNKQSTQNIANNLNHQQIQSHQQIKSHQQNHHQNQAQLQSKSQDKLSKRKLIKKMKFQRYYDNSMAKLLKQEKIQSEEYKNRQRITNQRKFKKYQKVKVQNSKTIKNLIQRINLQQKLIKNMKSTQQQALIPQDNIVNKQIQTDQFLFVNGQVEKVRQNQTKLQQAIRNLEKQRDDLKHMIQKLQVQNKQFASKNKLLQQQSKTHKDKCFVLTKQNEFTYKQIQKLSRKNRTLLEKIKENQTFYQNKIIQQQSKSDLLQQKLDSKNQREQQLYHLRNQLRNQIQQNSKTNTEHQKIRDNDKKQITLLQQKNSSLAQYIKQNTQFWTLFLVILQDSLSGFKQLNKNSKQLNTNIDIRPIQIKQMKNHESFSLFKRNKKQKEIIQIIDESQEQGLNQLSIQKDELTIQKGKQDLKIEQMQQEKPVENQPLPISNTFTVNQQSNKLNGQVSNMMVAQNIKQNENPFDTWISETIENLQSIISKRIKGFDQLQEKKIKQLKNIFRKLKFLNQLCSDMQKQHVFGKIFNDKDQILHIGYEFQLVNLSNILSQNQNIPLSWNETIFINSIQTQITDKQWKILVKNLNLYPKIVQISLSNNKVQNITKNDLKMLKFLKQINLTQCRLNQQSIKELVQFKKQNPHIQVIY